MSRGDPLRAMGRALAPSLDVAPPGLHCAFLRRKKNAAAIGSRVRLPGAGHSCFSPGVRAGAQGREHAPAPGARAAHSPAVKDHSTNNPLRPARGLGVPNPQGMRQPTPAPSGTSVPCLHAQCLRPTSTDGQDRTPPQRRRGRAADHHELASPYVGASSAGGRLRGASATCALQSWLVPRRQSEAGATRRMGENRHGGRRCHPQ